MWADSLGVIRFCSTVLPVIYKQQIDRVLMAEGSISADPGHKE